MKVHQATKDKQWLRIPDLLNDYGIPKGTVYRLLKTGRIKTAVLKTDSANARGVRLIERASFEAYLESQIEGKGGAA